MGWREACWEGREERRNGIDMELGHLSTFLSFLFKCGDKAEEEEGRE